MSAAVDRAGAVQSVHVRPVERRRGEWGMWLFIATEGALFVLLFFAYFYLGASKPYWPLEEDPSYRLALWLLAILVASSITAHWGQRGIETGDAARLKIGLLATLLLAAVFVFVQFAEFRNHLQTLKPDSSAYGSIFYTITSFHFAHLVLGILMLVFVLARALAGHFDERRHVAVKNATMYWHFVDVVWLFVVVIVYLSPRLYAPPPF